MFSKLLEEGKGKIKCRIHVAQVLDSPASAINQNLNTAIIILESVKPMEDFVKLVTPKGAKWALFLRVVLQQRFRFSEEFSSLTLRIIKT